MKSENSRGHGEVFISSKGKATMGRAYMSVCKDKAILFFSFICWVIIISHIYKANKGLYSLSL